MTAPKLDHEKLSLHVGDVFFVTSDNRQAWSTENPHVVTGINRLGLPMASMVTIEKGKEVLDVPGTISPREIDRILEELWDLDRIAEAWARHSSMGQLATIRTHQRD